MKSQAHIARTIDRDPGDVSRVKAKIATPAVTKSIIEKIELTFGIIVTDTPSFDG